MTRFLLAAGASLLLSACASGSAQTRTAAPETAAAAPAASDALKAPGQAQVGDRTTCPVSGDEFVVAADTPTFEHQGRTFHVCCDHCVDMVKANPEKFLGQYLR